MWILYAFCSALFAGLTTILAKIGIKNVDSNLTVVIRTFVVLIFSWLMVFIVQSPLTFNSISIKSIVFLILSGLATGSSWLCYFKALQLGDVNKVLPIDKSSVVITIILSFIVFNEKISIIKLFSLLLISLGTYLMITKSKNIIETNNSKWFLPAIFSALLASLSTILGKIGIENIESNLGVAIRTVIVLLMSIIVFVINKKSNNMLSFSSIYRSEIKSIDSKSILFIILSGISTGLSWLFYFAALQTGITSKVIAIDKLSILIAIGFSYFILKEKLTLKTTFGLILLTSGTFILLL